MKVTTEYRFLFRELIHLWDLATFEGEDSGGEVYYSVPTVDRIDLVIESGLSDVLDELVDRIYSQTSDPRERSELLRRAISKLLLAPSEDSGECIVEELVKNASPLYPLDSPAVYYWELVSVRKTGNVWNLTIVVFTKAYYTEDELKSSEGRKVKAPEVLFSQKIETIAEATEYIEPGKALIVKHPHGEAVVVMSPSDFFNLFPSLFKKLEKEARAEVRPTKS